MTPNEAILELQQSFRRFAALVSLMRLHHDAKTAAQCAGTLTVDLYYSAGKLYRAKLNDRTTLEEQPEANRLHATSTESESHLDMVIESLEATHLQMVQAGSSEVVRVDVSYRCGVAYHSRKRQRTVSRGQDGRHTGQ